MASNPMQRQKTISFWTGFIVALLIGAVIICGLLYMLYGKIKAENELKESMVTVYTLNKDVLSGQVITKDMITTKTVSKNIVPSNAISDDLTISSFSLKDDKGNEVYRDEEGLYVKEQDLKIELEKNSNGTYAKYIMQDNDGNVIYTDEEGMYIKKKNNNNEDEIIRIEEDKDGNYIKKENNRSVKITLERALKDNGRDKDIILSTVPLIAKVNMKANTIITRELVVQSDEVNTDDVRNQEYNMVTLPTMLETGDFVDIRMRMPNGVDYIVVSKKEVIIPDIAGVPSTDTIEVKMSEDEILTMSNAIVEAYIMKGAELYATKYTDPGNQLKSKTTYPVSKETMDLINENPNIVEEAKQALWSRYNTDQRNGTINNQLNNYSEEAVDNIESGIEEQIQKQKELRQQYLEALGGSIQ